MWSYRGLHWFDFYMYARWNEAILVLIKAFALWFCKENNSLVVKYYKPSMTGFNLHMY